MLVDRTGKLLDLVPKNIEIIDLKSTKTLLSIVKLKKIISQVNPDIVFSTLIRTHIAIDLALTGMNNKPKVIFRSPNSPKLLLENKQLSFLMQQLLDRAYKRADTIIAQTPEMKEEIEHYHNIQADKVSVLLNPIDSDLIDRSIQNIKNPFDTSCINVVAAGRLTEQKGFDILIKSFKKVITENSKFRLHIIGNGNMKEKGRLLRQVDDLDLENNISFLGFKTNPYKYFYYSDLYVLSSRWEGLPNTVLENLYLKKPVVATRCIPFMGKLIKDGKNGILVDVDDIMALSSAILNYKSINTNYSTINFKSSEIEDIFTNAFSEGKIVQC